MTTRLAGYCGRGQCVTCDGRGSQSPGPDTGVPGPRFGDSPL